MPTTTGPIHGRNTRVLLEGQDMSCQMRDASISLSTETVDVTAFCNSLKAYLTGLPDGRMSLSGFLDAGTTAGDYSILMPKFATGSRINFVVLPGGHNTMGLALAAQGIISSIQFSQQISDVQAMAMEVQLTGELYSMRTIQPITSSITGVAANARVQTDRVAGSVWETPYDSIGYTSGMVYYMFYNRQTVARTFTVYTSGTSIANGTTPSGGTSLASSSVAAGASVSGVAGTANTPVAVSRYVSGYVTNPGGTTETNYAYLGLVDLSQSLLNR